MPATPQNLQTPRKKRKKNFPGREISESPGEKYLKKTDKDCRLPTKYGKSAAEWLAATRCAGDKNFHQVTKNVDNAPEICYTSVMSQPSKDISDISDIIPAHRIPLTPELICSMLLRGHTQADIARATKRTTAAICQYIKRHANKIQILTDKTDNLLALRLKGKAHDILDSISEADLKRAGLNNKAMSIGILLDKSRLLSGQSTLNISLFSHIVEAAAKDWYQHRARDNQADSAQSIDIKDI